MATYKVIQDIEAEDKLVGPLTLRQFIYAGIAALCLYLCFLSLTKHAGFMIALFLPIAGLTGFFAFPWGKDQPTEVWALAKLRFMVKPRKRIWNQSGTKELVTVTAPKIIEHQYTNGLNPDEVQSRLSALANTIDSRGWAIKNVNVNMSAPQQYNSADSNYISDRLVAVNSMPQEVSNLDIRASDDILDETANPIAQQFDSMITASAEAHRRQLIAQMQAPSPQPTAPQPVPAAAMSYTPVMSQPTFPVGQTPAAMPQQVAPPAMSVQSVPQQSTATAPPANYWFMQPPPTTPGQAQFLDDPVVTPGAQAVPAVPQAAVPTAEEEALVQKFKQENSSQTVAYGHMKTVKTPQQIMAEEAQARAAAAVAAKPPVTPQNQAAIINLANNDDLDVATLARQARREVENDNGEVVISLR